MPAGKIGLAEVNLLPPWREEGSPQHARMRRRVQFYLWSMTPIVLPLHNKVAGSSTCQLRAGGGVLLKIVNGRERCKPILYLEKGRTKE